MRPGHLAAIALLVINGVVAFNACAHNPHVQYDADGHEDYVQVLAQGRLPGPEESSEFFVPPLPYLLPAFVLRATDDMTAALRAGQLFNVVLSVGITLLLLRTVGMAVPGAPAIGIVAVAFVGLVPAYYRTMAYVRGEPFVLFFSMATVYLVMRSLLSERPAWRRELALALSLGGLALSRQWGLLVIVSVLVFLVLHLVATRRPVQRYARVFALALVLGFVLCIPYYGSLMLRFGTPMAFNQDPEPQWRMRNQPLDFYFGLGLPEVFTAPGRPGYVNQLIPTLYSDAWGDYWLYFLVSGRTVEAEVRSGLRLAEVLGAPSLPAGFETNREAMIPYLARVNVVALLPTAVFLAGLIYGVVAARRWLTDGGQPSEMLAALSVIVIGVSVAGYLWFLIRFPTVRDGNTIKATYLIHVLPFAAMLAAIAVDALRRRSGAAAAALLVGVALTAAYLAPAFITHVYPVE